MQLQCVFFFSYCTSMGIRMVCTIPRAHRHEFHAALPSQVFVFSSRFEFFSRRARESTLATPSGPSLKQLADGRFVCGACRFAYSFFRTRTGSFYCSFKYAGDASQMHRVHLRSRLISFCD